MITRTLALALPALVFLFIATLPARLNFQAISASALLAVLLILFFADTKRQNPKIRIAISLISLLLSTRYIYWRGSETLPLEFGFLSIILGLLVFGAELYAYINGVLGSFISIQPNARVAIPLKGDPSSWPSADVYIPTYNEDPHILLATVIAATQLDYPKDKLNVYVLDDGGTAQKLHQNDTLKAAQALARTKEIQLICQQFGAHYLTREKNEHAKAGNMNAALSHTHGDLILILDCDHIPSRDFLQRTVGFFQADAKLFLVQTPHNFASPDPLERNLRTEGISPTENELFYDAVQPGLDSWGTTFFCGSAAVLRRSVINELGGFSGQTITEDAETTLDAMSLGYKTAYYARPMVSGLQPETFSGFILQRVRWSQGMIQIFLLKNPLKMPGLTVLQKLLYANFAFYWGFATSRLIMLIAPVMFLMFSVNLCNASPPELLGFAIPALLASLLHTQYLYGQVRWPFISQLYEVVQSVYVTRGLYEVIRKPRSPTFQVTPKGETLSSGFISTLAKPFYFLLLANLLALAHAIYVYGQPGYAQGAILYVGFWALTDAILLLCALGVTLERPQLRAEPRIPISNFPITAHVNDSSAEGYYINASSTGARVNVNLSQQEHQQLQLGMKIPLSFTQYPDTLPTVLKYIGPWQNDQATLGLRYTLTTTAQYRIAIDIAFGSSAQLSLNNDARHKGKSIVGSLFSLSRWAGVYGLAHLYKLLIKLIPRRPQP